MYLYYSAGVVRVRKLFCLSIYSLSQLQSYKMYGLLNIHIQFNISSLHGIHFTIVLEFFNSICLTYYNIIT